MLLNSTLYYIRTMNEAIKKRGRKAIPNNEKRVRTVLYLHPSNVRPPKELTAIIEGVNLPAREIDKDELNVPFKVQLKEKQREIDELKVLLKAREITPALKPVDPEYSKELDGIYGALDSQPLKDLFEAIAAHYNSGKVMKDRYITMMMQQAKSQAHNSRVPV